MPVPPSPPGVYTPETGGGPPPIAATPTAIAAFVGWAPQGPVGEAIPCASWADYGAAFGGVDPRGALGYAVSHFFANGGGRCLVVRLADAPLSPGTAEFSAALRDAGRPALEKADLFTLLNVPGLADTDDLAALIRLCRDRRAFLLVDSDQSGAAPPAALTGEGAMNAAYYHPWLLAPDPARGNGVRAFPPCGAVAGVYARTDAARGVWTAPAGLEADIRGVAGPTVMLTARDNERLNPRAVNCLRAMPGRGTVIWGARTLHGDDALGSDWKYVPVRRTALFIEESLRRGLGWAAVEPNAPPLWTRLRAAVEAFMHGLFRQGAFQGATPRHAYFIRCGGETTTQGEIDQGLVTIEIGFAPIKPAEFLVLRIGLAVGRTSTVHPRAATKFSLRR